MNDWPFTAREMTIVHFNFIGECNAAMARMRRESVTGAKRSFSMNASGGPTLDRAFRTLQRRAPR